MTIVADFDPRTPSIARVYDYLLDGKDNFAADREVAQRLLAVAPLAAEVTRENRQFLARAVTWTAGQGIRQFIDLGCGMPTAPNTHETARAIDAGARVAYLDNDAVVLSHLRALAAKGDPGVTVVDGDVREAAAVLQAVAAGIDLSAPACLLMGFLLHFFAPGAARTWWPGTSRRWRPGATSCCPPGAATATRPIKASAPTPPGRRGYTTTRCRSSPASSDPWSWSRQAWSTPGNGARTGNRPRISRPVTAR
jgi:hypothetical protein